MTIDPTITLIRGTASLALNDFDAYVRVEEDGLGLADVRRMVERGPLQHGDTDVGYRLEPRIVNFVLGMFGGDVAGYWVARRALQRMLKPSTVPLSLRITLPTTDVRQLDVVYAGGLSWPSDERLITSHRAGFQLRAADPTFYDPTLQSVVYGVGGSTDAWEIPWAIPWEIGAATIDSARSIANPGDWEAYPTIIIVGPINSPVITNVTTGEVLDFTGYNIGAGTTITIDTRYGVKSVTDQTGASQIDKLVDESDLATFHLAADPDAPDGENTVQVTGSSATSATEVYVQFHPRYIAL